MPYVIRYYTASHMAMDGDYAFLEEAREAYENKSEWYDQRLGAIVEGTTEFRDDVRHADPI